MKQEKKQVQVSLRLSPKQGRGLDRQIKVVQQELKKAGVYHNITRSDMIRIAVDKYLEES